MNGVTFDSRKEARRYGELLLMQRADSISDLRRQVTFELVPKQRDPRGGYMRSVKYIADFVYYDRRLGKTVVEDVKSDATRKLQAYVIKKKLMLQVHGIRITEV